MLILVLNRQVTCLFDEKKRFENLLIVAKSFHRSKLLNCYLLFFNKEKANSESNGEFMHRLP